MKMEANREAAQEWAGKGKQKLDEHDYEAAERFAEKSLRLFDSPETAALLEMIKIRARRAAAAQRVLTAVNYFELMGVARDESDVGIKKAYHRLCMELHPDKNCEPGAADAFKKLVDGKELVKILLRQEAQKEVGDAKPTTTSGSH